MFNLDNILNGHKTWDNNPHGKIVRHFVENGQNLVAVVFDGSPDKEYIYLEDTNA